MLSQRLLQVKLYRVRLIQAIAMYSNVIAFDNFMLGFLLLLLSSISLIIKTKTKIKVFKYYYDERVPITRNGFKKMVRIVCLLQKLISKNLFSYL